jgi:hypothetical protein
MSDKMSHTGEARHEFRKQLSKCWGLLNVSVRDSMHSGHDSRNSPLRSDERIKQSYHAELIIQYDGRQLYDTISLRRRKTGCLDIKYRKHGHSETLPLADTPRPN